MAPADAAFLWPEVRPHIKRALDREDHDISRGCPALRLNALSAVGRWNQATTEIEGDEIVIIRNSRSDRLLRKGVHDLRHRSLETFTCSGKAEDAQAIASRNASCSDHL